MEITLTQDKRAIVDDADEHLSVYKWQYNDTKRDGNGYAIRVETVNGKAVRHYMHRDVALARDGELVRHRNGNHLDNRRKNLQKITRSQRAASTNATSSSSGYRGVYPIDGTGKWRALITVNGRARQMGTFASPEIAAVMYDIAALKYFGDTAVLNFPGTTPDIPLRRAMHEHRRMHARQMHEAGRRTAPYVGVCAHKTTGKWRAVIQDNGKQKYLGVYAAADAAARAYDEESRRLYGPNAFTNFPAGNSEH